MTNEEVVRRYESFVVGSYRRDGVIFVRGKGSRLWDSDGKAYLDFFPGWAVSGLGHCPGPVVAAVRRQAGILMHVANNFYHPWQAELAERLSKLSFGGKVFFCNSGGEANEAALKLCRLAGRDRGRYKIISMENSFHGRTLATVTMTGQPVYSAPFAPLPEGFSYVPFNDFAALERAADEKTAAVFLELIQGEGGINVVDRGYLEKVVVFCRERGMLIAVDEVQTGFGRTGSLFAFQQFGFIPDIITLAKTMGGGFPVGAMVARADIADLMVPGTHASTFGGGPLACASSLAVLDMIEKKNLLARTRRTGAFLQRRLERLKKTFSCIVRVKGMGLMLGLELDRPGADLVTICRNNGLLINCTHQTIIRVMPAITVTRREINDGLAVLEKSIAEFMCKA